jgi:hypothetical protein
MRNRFVAVMMIFIVGLASAGNAQVTATAGEKLSAAIARLQDKGGAINFPCGSYDADSTIDIAADGVWLRGSGYCSRIRVTSNTDVFNVTGALFALEGFEIIVDTAQDRAGANFIRGGGSQGRVSHVRFTGSYKLANNGRVFYADSQAGGLWFWEDVRFTGGSTWRAFLALTSATDKTVASTRVSNVVGAVSFTDAAFDLNGAIDTFQVIQIDLPLRKGRAFWLHNGVNSPISPRLVYCQANCSIETRGGSTAIQLDASRDFSYHGFIAGADVTGVYVGPGAIDTDLSHITFMNLMKGAITIAAGSINTMVKDNFFEDTTNQEANRYDTISVEPGASNFQIIGNTWRSTNRYKARYAINLAAGRTSNFRVLDNQIAIDIYGTGSVSNAATGPNFVIMGNDGTANKSDLK